MKRPVYLLCPVCRFVVEKRSEEADTPTADTRLDTKPCPKCQRQTYISR